MLLKDLLTDIYDGSLSLEDEEIEISSLCSDSRAVKEGSLFVALCGTCSDGANFIPDAIANGAKVIVCHKQASIASNEDCALLIRVADTQEFLEQLVKRFFGDPSQTMSTIGITGTNGKTTVTYILESIAQAANKTCGIMGTVNYRYGHQTFKAQNTTPGIIDVYQHLTNMAAKHCDYCFMEVSSHALDQRRVAGIDFKVAVFTNLTSDHLDYHKNKDEYFLAKAKLFANLKEDAIALVNLDDPSAHNLRSLTKAQILTYSVNDQADIMAKNIELGLNHSQFILVTPQGDICVDTQLIGIHNISNILAAAGVAYAQKISLENIKEGIESLAAIPGRLEPVQEGQDFYLFIDYAHTEDALRNVLQSIKNVSDKRIILVFGCGGDRDQKKRSRMGKVASQLADFSIVTNDNPRSEDPKKIVEQIKQGFESEEYKVILDRQKAIEEAIIMAESGEVVLIAGKGHEDYQIFKDQTIDFNEKAIIQSYLKNVCARAH